MGWIKKVGIGLVVVVAALVLVGWMLPTKYEVTRAVVVEAPVPVIHALVSDLEEWPRWEPWTHADPSVEVARGEQTTGVGASQSWTDAHGGGSLTFTNVDPEQGVAYSMLFADKYPGQGSVTYETMEAGGVAVTWTMDGDAVTPVVGGYFARLMPGMIAPMFEDGLRRLKEAAEADAAGAAEVPAPPVDADAASGTVTE